MEDIIVPVVFFICTAFTIVGLPLARAYARRLDRRSTSTDSPEVVQRLERMEQAIDSIAVEVERISEGQRFTTKLLAGRESAASPPAVANEVGR